MFSLAPYAHTPNRLEDYLPWAMLVAPGIVLNKDGSFQATARFRGPDVRSSTPEELVAFTARANNVFRRLGHGWAVYIEADLREIAAADRAAERARVEERRNVELQWRERLLREINVHAVLFHEGLTLMQRDRHAAAFADPEGARILICSSLSSPLTYRILAGRCMATCSIRVLLPMPG